MNETPLKKAPTIDPTGKVSASLIAVQGDIKIRVQVLWIVGTILTLLVLGGIVGLIMKPDVFANYWAGVLPLTSGALFGLIGFIVGKRVGPQT